MTLVSRSAATVAIGARDIAPQRQTIGDDRGDAADQRRRRLAAQRSAQRRDAPARRDHGDEHRTLQRAMPEHVRDRMQRRARAEAVEQGIGRGAAGRHRGKRERVPRLRARAQQRQQAQADQGDADHGLAAEGVAGEIREQGRADDRHDHRRQAAHQGVERAELAAFVRAGQRDLVGDMDADRAGDPWPRVGVRQRQPGQGDERQRDRASGQPSDAEQGVGLAFERGVPACVQQRGAENSGGGEGVDRGAPAGIRLRRGDPRRRA